MFWLGLVTGMVIAFGVVAIVGYRLLLAIYKSEEDLDNYE